MYKFFPEFAVPPTMRIRAGLWRALGFVLLWWVLAEGDTKAWGVGLASVVLATVVSLHSWPLTSGRFSVAGASAFAAWFLVESVKGGLQVAALAFQRRPDLAPGWIEVPLALPAGPATVLLANVLSLMPGTLNAGVDGQTLRLHVLDARLPVTDEVRAAEVRIAAMLRLRLTP